MHLVGTVVDDDLEAESTSQVLSRLSLAGTSRSSGSSSHRQIQGLCQRDVTSVSEGRDDESTSVSDILIVVPGLPIANCGGH